MAVCDELSAKVASSSKLLKEPKTFSIKIIKTFSIRTQSWPLSLVGIMKSGVYTWKSISVQPKIVHWLATWLVVFWQVCSPEPTCNLANPEFPCASINILLACDECFKWPTILLQAADILKYFSGKGVPFFTRCRESAKHEIPIKFPISCLKQYSSPLSCTTTLCLFVTLYLSRTYWVPQQYG